MIYFREWAWGPGVGWMLIGGCRAKPKSLFAKTSSKNLGAGGALFGEKLPSPGSEQVNQEIGGQ